MESLRSVAEGLAARVGRPVTIDDPQLRLLAHTSHHGRSDPPRIASVLDLQAPDYAVAHVRSHAIATAVGPTRVPGRPDLGIADRVVVPIRHDGQLLGYVWLIEHDDDRLDERELAYAAETAEVAAQLLREQHLIGDRRRRHDRELLRDLLVTDATIRRSAMSELVGQDRLPEHTPIVVLVVRVDVSVDDGADTFPEVARTELDGVLTRTATRIPASATLSLTSTGGRGTLLIADRMLPPSRLSEEARRIATSTDEAVGRPGSRVAIGPVVPTLDQAHVSFTRASDALRVADALPEYRPVVAYSQLGVFQLLVQLPSQRLRHDGIPAGLHQLLGRDTHTYLVQTLETYLDLGGDVRSAAEALQIHRATLYYRLSRIEELTGMSLSNGVERLSLHLGLKAQRLLGAD